MPGIRVPPRSAEQTSRLLLSSAFRYDTIETAENKRLVRDGKHPLFTVKLELSHLVCASSVPPEENDDTDKKNAKQKSKKHSKDSEKDDVVQEEAARDDNEKKSEKKKKEKTKAQKKGISVPIAPTLLPPSPPPVAVNLVLFDPRQKLFLGAAHRIPLERLSEPFAFQAAAKQYLVVEVLAEHRPLHDLTATGGQTDYRVVAWGFFPVESLRHARDLPLYPGSGQLLYMEENMWPEETHYPAKIAASLSCKASLSDDAALIRLMTELVPPGLIVPYAFAMDTPNPKAKFFRVVLDALQLQASSTASEADQEGLLDPETVWSVAAIVHNGYQQLCEGAEVPLRARRQAGGATHIDSRSHSSTDDYSYSYSSEGGGKSPKVRHRNNHQNNVGAGDDSTFVLEALFPIELNQLPVHASTSLVLAIRRRLPGSAAEVLGFCVFPLCLLPMKDRDLRVESLPALQGPFSCEDARMLLTESTTPYGRLPYTITLSLAFYDTEVAESRSSELDAAISERLSKDVSTDKSPASVDLTAVEGRIAGSAKEIPVVPEKSPSASESRSNATEEAAPPVEVDIAPNGVPPDASPTTAASPAAREQQPATSTTMMMAPAGIFEFLGKIMEELHRVRVAQDDVLKMATSSGRQLPSALKDRIDAKLSDDAADVIDLRPQPVAVPWLLRHKMVESAQPIIHPLKGSRIDDFSRAAPTHTRSLFGIRFEGITMDPAFDVPEDLCFMFSYGPLPCQKVGPVQTARVQLSEETACDGTKFTSKSYQFWDEQNNGGVVWCESTAAEYGGGAHSMEYFKREGQSALLYIHVYDALTMFYLCTAPVALSHFHRPYHAEAALIPMDLPIQRDLSLTEQPVPSNIFPVVMHAGQLHVTLFCAAAPPLDAGDGSLSSHRLTEPLNGSRLVLAKKLEHASRLFDAPADDSAPAATRQEDGKEVLQIRPFQSQDQSLHWKRAQYFKKSLRLQRAQGGGLGPSPLSSLPGVPDEHICSAISADPVSMEYRLRVLEKERDAAKSRAIASALRERLTVRHELQVAAWRPHTISTPFENPYNTVVEFYIDIPQSQQDVCSTPAKSLVLGPREKVTIPLVIRLHSQRGGESGQYSDVVKLSAKVYTQQQHQHLIRVIDVVATILPPLVDRRLEIFGPPGSSVTKSYYSRLYSTASFPAHSTQEDLVKRLNHLCATVSVSSNDTTSAATRAMLDPITQHYITAWEEVVITTKVPEQHGQQRVEYVTLYRDAERMQILEVWELNVFPCFSITTREIFWGQTTSIALPAEDTEDMYCSSSRVKVEPGPSSYLIHVKPSGVGSDRMLLHTLRQNALIKTILTIPVVYPTPTATQVIELSMEDVKKGPVLRRLTFVHRGTREEHFSVHHNYKFQLQVAPSSFILAPGDTQHIHLHIGMLALPAGQLEGRWPMWIFINDARDKTVESYYLQVVLRVHPVALLEVS